MRDVCKVMGLEGQLWSEFMKHGQPKMVCPFKKTTYKITEAVCGLGIRCSFTARWLQMDFHHQNVQINQREEKETNDIL